VKGHVLDVRTRSPDAGRADNANFSSRVPGYGQPCNLPPAEMASKYGANYTLADCQASP